MPDKENKALPPPDDHDPATELKPSGLRSPEPEPELIKQAEAEATNAGRKIADNLLGVKRRDQLKIVRAFRSQVIPPGRPGRRRKEGITAAHKDWKAGMRGVALYRKHISGWERFSQWRRKVEERRLMDAVRSRERRARAAKKIEPR